MAARQAAAPAQGAGGGLFGGPGIRVVSSGGGDMAAQIRQRMLQRYQQDFASFRATLDDNQRARWDRALNAIVGARRAPLYRLVDGQPRAVMVRVGASDGSATEIAGDLAEGDLVITGERAAP